VRCRLDEAEATLNRSRIASWVAVYFAVIAVVLFAAGVPVGWLSPLLLVTAVAQFLAVWWRKTAQREVLGMPELTSVEKAALKGKVALADVLEATPRLEYPQ
jgi:cell division protein FtsW (lipid II flippase)